MIFEILDLFKNILFSSFGASVWLPMSGIMIAYAIIYLIKGDRYEN